MRFKLLDKLLPAAALTVLLLGAGAPAALAEGPEAPSASPASDPQVQFTVTAIEASKKKGKIDPALGHFSKYLAESFKDFRNFVRLDQKTSRVKPGKETRLTMPGGRELVLRYEGLEGKRVKVDLDFDGLKTTIAIRDGGLFFQAGRKHGDGILVLAIEARTL